MKWYVCEDPLKDSNKLPIQKDFQKHFYNTVAKLNKKGHPLDGKLGMFSEIAITTEAVPYYMFFPFKGKNGIEVVMATEISYHDLEPNHPLTVGWRDVALDALIGISRTNLKQWQVGLSGQNTHLSIVQFGMCKDYIIHEHLVMESCHNREFFWLMEMLALINTKGEPDWNSFAKNANEVVLNDSISSCILGRRVAISTNLIFFLGINDPIGLVQKGEILTGSPGSARIIVSTVSSLPVKSVGTSKFNELVKEYRGLTQNKRSRPKSPAPPLIPGLEQALTSIVVKKILKGAGF